MTRTPEKPFGNRPSGVWKFSRRKGWEPSEAIGWKPSRAAPPSTMRATTATTFTRENQYSVSPKTRAEKAFTAKTTAAKTTHHTQTPTEGNQRCISSPHAVNSEPRATAQVSQ